jgi:hypothetical protein
MHGLACPLLHPAAGGPVQWHGTMWWHGWWCRYGDGLKERERAMYVKDGEGRVKHMVVIHVCRHMMQAYMHAHCTDDTC